MDIDIPDWFEMPSGWTVKAYDADKRMVDNVLVTAAAGRLVLVLDPAPIPVKIAADDQEQ